jgi:hypothetical protein
MYQVVITPTAVPDQLLNVRLPVDIVLPSGEIHADLLTLIESRTLAIDVKEPGPYWLRTELPDGRRLTARSSEDKQSIELSFALQRGHGGERSNQRHRSTDAPILTSASSEPLLSDETTVRMSSVASQEFFGLLANAKEVRLYRDEDNVELHVIGLVSGSMPGAFLVPTQNNAPPINSGPCVVLQPSLSSNNTGALLALPPLDYGRAVQLNVHDTCNPDVTPIGASCETGDHVIDAVAGFLKNGSTTYAYRMTPDLQAHVRELVDSATTDAVLACAAGYYLQRLNNIDDLGVWNLLFDRFHAFADTAILLGWAHIRVGDIERALDYFLAAFDRGIPLYTEGIRLLRDGLSFLASLSPNHYVLTEASASANRLYAAANPLSLFCSITICPPLRVDFGGVSLASLLSKAPLERNTPQMLALLEVVYQSASEKDLAVIICMVAAAGKPGLPLLQKMLSGLDGTSILWRIIDTAATLKLDSLPMLEQIVARTDDAGILCKAASATAGFGAKGVPLLSRIASRTNLADMLWWVIDGADKRDKKTLPVLEWAIEMTDQRDLLEYAAEVASTYDDEAVVLLERIDRRKKGSWDTRRAVINRASSRQLHKSVLDWLLAQPLEPDLQQKIVVAIAAQGNPGLPYLQQITAENNSISLQAAARVAAANGKSSLKLLQWIIEHQSSHGVWHQAAEGAASAGKRGLRALEWMADRADSVEDFHVIIRAAATIGKAGIPLLEHITLKYEGSDAFVTAIQAAKDLALVDWIITKTRFSEVLEIAAGIAAANGQGGLHLLGQIVATSDDVEIYRSAARGVAAGVRGDDSVIAWLMERTTDALVVRSLAQLPAFWGVHVAAHFERILEHTNDVEVYRILARAEPSVPFVDRLLDRTKDPEVMRLIALRATATSSGALPILARLLSVADYSLIQPLAIAVVADFKEEDLVLLEEATAKYGTAILAVLAEAAATPEAEHNAFFLLDSIEQLTADRNVLLQLARSAGTLGGKGVPLLTRITAKLSDVEVFREAAKGAASRNVNGLPALQWLLDHISDVEVFRLVAEGAGSAGTVGITLLERMVGSDLDEELFRHAAKGAGGAGSQALPVLEWMLVRTSDPGVLRRAAEAAATLGAEGLGVLAWIANRTDDEEIFRAAEIGARHAASPEVIHQWIADRGGGSGSEFDDFTPGAPVFPVRV